MITEAEQWSGGQKGHPVLVCSPAIKSNITHVDIKRADSGCLGVTVNEFAW
jgi:hypothetical protein